MSAHWTVHALCVASAIAILACQPPEAARKAVLARAKAALDAGDSGRAVEALTLGLRRDPRDIALVTRLAEVERERGNPSAALQTLRALPADVAPDVPYRKALAAALLDLDRPLMAAGALVALDKEGKAEASLVDALVAALAHDKTLPQAVSGLPLAWRRRVARAFLEGSDLGRAAEHALALPASDSERAALREAIVERALERDEIPVVEAHRALLDPPPSAAKLLARHRILVARGDWEAADSVEEEFLRGFPGERGRLEMLLSRATRRLRAGRAAEAVDLLDQAIALDPRRVDPLVERGLALETLGRTGEAKASYEQALALDPGNAAARRRLEERAKIERPRETGKGQGSFSLRIEAASDGG